MRGREVTGVSRNLLGFACDGSVGPSFVFVNDGGRKNLWLGQGVQGWETFSTGGKTRLFPCRVAVSSPAGTKLSERSLRTFSGRSVTFSEEGSC